MSRYLRLPRKQPASPPGTLVYSGPERDIPVSVHRIHYHGEAFEEAEIAPDQVREERPEPGTVTWFDVDGAHDPDVVARFAEAFGLHPLGAEDILSLGQRPKVEDYEKGVHVVLKMLTFGPDHDEILSEQVTFVLADGVLMSFQERPGDVFEPVRERIRRGKGRIRTRGTDYLLYTLMDATVDGYFAVAAELSRRVEVLEELSLEDPPGDFPRRVQELRKEALLMRRATWPLRDVLDRLMRNESDWIRKETVPFLRDVQDHLVQVIESVELMREALGTLMETHVSSVGMKANEIMMVLTLIATIFIPLTFLAGIYGMNFAHMPELDWPWAYPTLLGLMFGIALGMVAFFRRKGWI
jgi:magnesium transporter